jgi:hypothetical protein
MIFFLVFKLTEYKNYGEMTFLEPERVPGNSGSDVRQVQRNWRAKDTRHTGSP